HLPDTALPARPQPADVEGPPPRLVGARRPGRQVDVAQDVQQVGDGLEVLEVGPLHPPVVRRPVPQEGPPHGTVEGALLGLGRPQRAGTGGGGPARRGPPAGAGAGPGPFGGPLRPAPPAGAPGLAGLARFAGAVCPGPGPASAAPAVGPAGAPATTAA